MTEFLSDDWIQALDRAARSRRPPPDLDGLVLDYDVDGNSYHLVFSGATLRVRPGRAEHPTVTFRCDRTTATAIARGASSAQRAFMSGKLRIGGEASALMRAQPAVAALPDLFAAVRAETDWADTSR